MDKNIRKGETAAYPFRSERIFNANGGWYFSTREEMEVGPFSDRPEAHAALLEFLRKLATQDQEILS